MLIVCQHITQQAIGFRRFLLRDQEKASLEWTLVTTSYNLKRLFNLGMSLQRARAEAVGGKESEKSTVEPEGGLLVRQTTSSAVIALWSE